MSQALIDMLQVDAEVRVPNMTAQLVRFHVADPVDIRMLDRDEYWLDVCLQPRPRNSVACYVDRWGAQRFERIGNMYLLPPGEAVQTRSDGGPAHDSILCHLHPDAMRRWFEEEAQWTDRRLQASLDIADHHVHNLLLRLAEELRHPGFASEMLVELIGAQLTIELGRYFARFDKIPPTGALASWRLRKIDERLRDGNDVPSLDELAKLCNLSVRQLTRGFRVSRGCSIGDYVVQSRIERAKQLLGSDDSIKSIAYSLGFRSPSNFCFAFRRATGMTPGEYRGSAAR